MVVLLTDREVMEAISGQEAIGRSIRLTEESFRSLATNDGVGSRPGNAIVYPPTARMEHEGDVWLDAPMGIIASLNAMAGTFTPIGKRGTTLHRYQMLFDFTTLELLSIQGNTSIHTYQVGAQVGVGTKWLARMDAESVGVLGSSKMALGSLRAICAVRKITRASVFSPTEANRRRFAEDASTELGIDIRPVDEAEKAVRGMDIVTCATNNWVRGGGKVLEAEWVSPGTHINTISRSELGEDAAWIGRVFPATTDSVVGATPPWEPWKNLLESGEIGDHLGPDLTGVVKNEQSPREEAEEITVYLGANLGTHRVAMGVWAFEEAKKRGLGSQWKGA